MTAKTLLIALITTSILLSDHGFVHAEDGINANMPSVEQNEEQRLQDRIQKLQAEIRQSQDKSAYDILKTDLNRTQQEVKTLEINLEENQNLKQAKEKQKAELEEKLRIREQQLASDPTNTGLQNEIDSIKKQIGGDDGKSGLNYSIKDYGDKINQDRKSLDQLLPKRNQLQQQYDSHSLTQKQNELKSTQEQWNPIHNENERNRLIEKLNEMNASINTFPVKKYLSVGHEAEIELFSQGNKSPGFIDRIIQFALQTLGTLAILMMIVAGYFLIASEGDENRIQKGKNIVFYTVIGLLVAFISYALVQFILSILFRY